MGLDKALLDSSIIPSFSISLTLNKREKKQSNKNGTHSLLIFLIGMSRIYPLLECNRFKVTASTKLVIHTSHTDKDNKGQRAFPSISVFGLW